MRHSCWDDESADYIRGRGDRYVGGCGIEPAWAQQALDDIDLVAFEPDPKSRMGASRFIGFSVSAQRVLVVIAFRDADVTCTASMRGRRPVPTCDSIERGPAMAKTIDPALAARLREESEGTREVAYPAGVRPTRPNRSKVYSIRLSEEEQAHVQQVADAKHLPASTLVRSWILDRLNQEKTA